MESFAGSWAEGGSWSHRDALTYRADSVMARE
jgi:hypothetical protein